MKEVRRSQIINQPFIMGKNRFFVEKPFTENRPTNRYLRKVPFFRFFIENTGFCFLLQEHVHKSVC